MAKDGTPANAAATHGVRAPAMVDVARLAGVSHMTVSRVLNDHPSVRDETRLRVRAAMDQLGYRRNSAARTLVTGRSQVVGVVAQSSTLYGPASLLAAFEIEAATADLSVAVASVRRLDRESIVRAVDLHLAQRVAGIVVIAPVESASEAMRTIPGHIPLVAIDGDPAGGASVVTVNQAEGARLATQHLLDAGHDTVWHVSGPAGWFDSRGRVEGWRATLEAAGADVPPPIQAADWSPASGYAAGQMLARMREVSAVFAANDHLALGIMRALTERGLSVPEDLSVVGFDDIPEAAYLSPPLTTVRPNFAAVARASLEALQDQIEATSRTVDVHTVAPDLILRESVARRA